MYIMYYGVYALDSSSLLHYVLKSNLINHLQKAVTVLMYIIFMKIANLAEVIYVPSCIQVAKCRVH